MKNLIERIELEDGDTYELFSTGKSFKSVVTYPERTLRDGTPVASWTKEVRHGHYDAAVNYKRRVSFVKMKDLEA